jgi:hypothetical protein
MPTAPYITVLGVSPARLPSESCGDTNNKRDGGEPGPSVSTAWPAAGHFFRLAHLQLSVGFSMELRPRCSRKTSAVKSAIDGSVNSESIALNVYSAAHGVTSGQSQ